MRNVLLTIGLWGQAERKLRTLPFDSGALSERFSWLPTTFSVSSYGKKIVALDYINGLNVFTEPTLVPLLENLLGLFLPLWSRTLSI